MVEEKYTNKDESVMLDGIKAYLKSIGNHPRLTLEEEQELSRRAKTGDTAYRKNTT